MSKKLTRAERYERVEDVLKEVRLTSFFSTIINIRENGQDRRSSTRDVAVFQ